MKILFVSAYFLPYRGGIERVIEKLSKQYLDSGKASEVGVLTTKYEFPRRFKGWQSREAIGEIKVFRLNSFPKKPPPIYPVPLVWFDPLKIKEIINEFRPDVIHLMGDKWFWGNLFVLLFKGNAKVIFSPIFHKLGTKTFIRPINHLISSLANKLHVVTKDEKKKVIRSYGVGEGKFTIIPWGIDIGKRQAPKSTDKKIVSILCVGRLSKHKGQKWLLARYANCLPYFKKKTKLIFVGMDEGDGSYLKTMVKDLNLEKEISIVGEVSDKKLNNYYDNADIFTLFSGYETFGLVFLEAMGKGLPVLTHDVGTVREILENKAIIVDAYNEGQAEDNLIKLVNNKKYRDNIGYLSYQYVKDNYSWKKTAEKLLQIYAKA